MDCFLCQTNTPYGSVCRECRQHFRPFLNEEEEPMYDCENCDFHSFPCLNCAHYTYQGLGNGRLSHEDLSVYEEDKPISPHDYMLILNFHQAIRIEI
jgi:hypothetical protein